MYISYQNIKLICQAYIAGYVIAWILLAIANQNEWNMGGGKRTFKYAFLSWIAVAGILLLAALFMLIGMSIKNDGHTDPDDFFP
jgi:hypothetical protein